MRIGKLGFALSRLLLAASIAFVVVVGDQTARAAAPPTTMPAVDASLTGTETIVFLRHGEKPKGGLGQLTPQGLNRALALSTVLPAKYGKPDFIFAPDPAGKSDSDPKKKSPGYNYIRPLMTIEPTAIALGMPVQTPFTFPQIDKLDQELDKPEYATSLIFVAWEHVAGAKAAKNLVQQFGGDPAQVPAWDGKDFDSLYVVKIVRVAGQRPTAIFKHDHEGLDHQSQQMPIPPVVADH